MFTYPQNIMLCVLAVRADFPVSAPPESRFRPVTAGKISLFASRFFLPPQPMDCTLSKNKSMSERMLDSYSTQENRAEPAFPV